MSVAGTARDEGGGEASMVGGAIFEHARRAPGRLALIHNGRAFSYGAFAGRILAARDRFEASGLSGGGYAVLQVYDLLDYWTFSLALRDLGLTTVATPSPAAIPGLGLEDVRCVVRNEREIWPDLERICAEGGLPLDTVSLAPDATAAPPPRAERPETPGHVLLTSGTTGNYKKVLRTQAFDAAFNRRSAPLLGIGRDSIVCLFDFAPWTGVGYNLAVTAWDCGGAVVTEQGERHRPLRIPGLTHALAIPGMLSELLAAPQEAYAPNPDLRFFVCGGSMTRAQIAQAKARITPRLFDLLGSTETGETACTPLETDDDRRWLRPVPGRVIEIVDEEDRPVADGELGQMRIDASESSSGYLGDEEATKAFFRNGFFYPGDLAVRRADGRFALRGRATDVINIMGNKVSPAPIEERLRDALGVDGVCLFSMPDAAGEEQIHVVIESPAPPDVAGLAPILAAHLRGFPSARVHHVRRLPRNHMGKLLRQAARAQALASDQRAPAAQEADA